MRKKPKTPISPLTAAEKKTIAALLRSAAESTVKEKRKQVNEQKEIEAIGSQITEFLDSYILLGYTFEGNPVQIVFANTQQQADSLSKLLVNFVQEGI